VWVRDAEDYGPYLVAGPHEDYYGFCRGCALASPETVMPIAPE